MQNKFGPKRGGDLSLFAELRGRIVRFLRKRGVDYSTWDEDSPILGSYNDRNLDSKALADKERSEKMGHKNLRLRTVRRRRSVNQSSEYNETMERPRRKKN